MPVNAIATVYFVCGSERRKFLKERDSSVSRPRKLGLLEKRGGQLRRNYCVEIQVGSTGLEPEHSLIYKNVFSVPLIEFL